MVNHSLQLDLTFRSLADPIRRDILHRLGEYEISVSELAQKYNVSLVAISKHLKVLEKAKLIRKRREGRRYIVALVPETLKDAEDYLQQYQQMWASRHDKLEKLLKEED